MQTELNSPTIKMKLDHVNNEYDKDFTFYDLSMTKMVFCVNNIVDSGCYLVLWVVTCGQKGDNS